MMRANKNSIVICLGACGLVHVQAQSRTDLIESARTEKEANLTPETPTKGERAFERVENSFPYRLLTSQTGGFGVSFSNVVPGSGFALAKRLFCPRVAQK
jgi:hypothetical protein